MSKVLAPGATIGVLGSGQLGRMFAISARRMGYRVHVLSPDDDTPTGQVADVETNSPYDDLDRVARFAQNVGVVTFEFENVPAAAIQAAARYAPVHPRGEVLETTQHRTREKTFLREQGFPVADFAVVHSLAELEPALVGLGHPAVLKTAAWGYDGKGQVLIRQPHEAAAAWQSLGTGEAVLEQFVDFQVELSVIVARDQSGSTATYGPLENQHVRHILDLSCTPARLPPGTAAEAVELARAIAVRLDVVGVLCVEMFLTREGQLLVNELAPRPHNSGHLTIDAHVTCQFEQQVRAVCGLALGSTRQHSPAAMANLLGDLWLAGPLDWAAVAGEPEVRLHLYGKREARPGRKMGHLTALGPTVDSALARAQHARRCLQPAVPSPPLAT